MLTNADSINELLDHCQEINRDGKTYFWLPKMMEVDELGAITLHDFGNPDTPLNIQLLQLQMQGNQIQDKIMDLCRACDPDWKVYHILGTHSCTKSPIGLCVYDQRAEDPLAECIHCKQPFHRG